MSRKSLNQKLKFIVPAVLLLLIAGAVAFFLANNDIAILNPKGEVAQKQFNLIVFTSLLALVVIIPVYTLTFYIAWKYRASNKKARYNPDWDRSKIIEGIWWLVPLTLITILAVVTWKSSHDLNPYKPIASDKKPLTIEVVALQWKWLFIYPEQGIASVNFVQFPKDTPIDFKVTSDAPMNSFWIPQLGGQIYAMSGMSTHLHLLAEQAGDYNGSSANISGHGFAGMKFTAKASSQADFDAWVQSVKQSPDTLSLDAYDELAEPSEDNPVTYYADAQKNLYDTIIMKYMSPEKHVDHMGDMHE